MPLLSTVKTGHAQVEKKFVSGDSDIKGHRIRKFYAEYTSNLLGSIILPVLMPTSIVNAAFRILDEG
jgi:hypothetical protein